MTDRRPQLLCLLADIEQEIAEAESLAAEAPNDEILVGASEQLAELREAWERPQRLLSAVGAD